MTQIVQLHESRSRVKLNPNFEEGFNEAVNNGQVRMALEYARHLIKELKNQVNALEEANKHPQAAAVIEEQPEIADEHEQQPQKPKRAYGKKVSEESQES